MGVSCGMGCCRLPRHRRRRSGGMKAETWMYVAALALQLEALVQAVRLVRRAATAARGPWAVLAAALPVMLLFRIWALFATQARVGAILREEEHGLVAAAAAMGISALLLVAMFSIRRI